MHASADLQQIQDAQAGDELALQALFEQWLPTVMAWCARLGGPFVDPEDAAQDVLIRAFGKLPALRDPAAFDAWMFSLTRRVLAWHRRQVWLRRWMPGASVERTDPDTGPESRAASQEVARRVHDILEDLAVAQREVVVLCCIEERTTAEVAHLIGVSQGTVKSRLQRGKSRFAAMARRRGLRPDAPTLISVKS
ncbi:MAG: RNA polymerase sigma factor [Myxococcota bacterium]